MVHENHSHHQPQSQQTRQQEEQQRRPSSPPPPPPQLVSGPPVLPSPYQHTTLPDSQTDNHIPIRVSPVPALLPLAPAKAATTAHSLFFAGDTSVENRMRIEIPPLPTTPAAILDPTPTGTKRASPSGDFTPNIHNNNNNGVHSSKRTRLDSERQGRVTVQDEVVRDQGSFFAKSPDSDLGSGSALAGASCARSPVPFAGTAEAMHTRPDGAGGNRTTRVPRGLPPNSLPPHSSPGLKTRHPSDHSIPTIKSLARSNSIGLQALEQVNLGEYLQQDERPIFALDLEQQFNQDTIPIIFSNSALKAKPTLFENVFGRFDNAALLLDAGTAYHGFRSWLTSDEEDVNISNNHSVHSSNNYSTSGSLYPFAGFNWKMSTVNNNIRIVTGIPIQAAPPLELGRSGTLQKFRHLGSSSSNHTARRTPPDQHANHTQSPFPPPQSQSSHHRQHSQHQPQGYFDVTVADARRKTTSPLIMEGLMSRSLPTDEAESPTDVVSNGHPASHGDNGMQELLEANHSPIGNVQFDFVPRKSNPEHLQPMSMEYLSDRGFFDWTRMPLSPSLPQHIQFARGFDWAKTSLGPIEEWPADLRGMCNLIMASPHPSAMYWGPDHVAIYNEPYVMLAGNKHPALMGRRYQDAWPEIWNVVGDVFATAMSSAQATMKDDDCLFIIRNGFLEEAYFSWSIIPLIGDDGSVAGLYNPAFEKTRRKIAERRMLTLREIGERTAAARAVSQFWGLLLNSFDFNEYDAPLVIIYSLNESEESDAASSTSSTAAASKQCRLEGVLGAQPGDPCAPEAIDLKNRSNKGFGAIFKRSITSDRPIVLSIEDGTLDPALLENVQWRGFGDPSTICVIAPIRPTTGESTLGFLVMGTNPRRPYDEDYDLFVQLLSRQLATSIASVVLFEEEIRKGEAAARMAAQDRMDLTKQLAVRTQEAAESENKFTRMAELAPVGMFICDAAGSITFANEAWYKLSSYPRDTVIGNDWIDMIIDEDKDIAKKAWSEMLVKRCKISIEFRFKTIWKDNLGQQSHMWVIASASPEKDEDGNITTIFGSMTDISSQKVAEELQRKRMEEAVLLKQQQERYIDTTSHEMRNPLSAILQSADAITGSLTDLKIDNDVHTRHTETIDSIIESAQTITLCAQHQKRIVDDVLTLSKLDSAMLLVTPVDVRPEAIARQTVRIFEGESHTVDISLNVQVDESYRKLGIEYVRLDPTRLSQVLINLMTNAIKFTTTQEKREVNMLIAASREKPSREPKYSLTYIPSQAPKDKDVTAAPEWGLGEPIYIHFAVSDTGRGLNDNEKKQLFQRFSQANPRTHVTYGGSGLGLFISRELVELQGGEIGVASEAGKGSTFAFYVKGRRSAAPADGTDDDQPDHRHKIYRKASTSARNSKLSQISTQAVDAENKQGLVSPRTTVGQMAKSKADANGLNVLIVEDNLINQKVLAAQLRKLGCIVSVANHGGEAIDHIRKSNFYNHSDPNFERVQIDVVLMDLEMPVMDGMTCARTLRAMQSSGELLRHVPVIAVTANAREEQIRNTLDAGIDDVVSKPFRIPELVPKMRDTIARFASGRSSDASVQSMKMDVDSQADIKESLITAPRL